jgi:hypothetical protein
MSRRAHGVTFFCTLMAMAILVGCSKEEPAPLVTGGGKELRPGDRAIQRAVPYLFTLIQLEERDRVFGMVDKDHEVILASLKQLDETRMRLIKALEQTAHQDLAYVLTQKRLTCMPESLDVVLNLPKVVEYKVNDQELTALVKVSLTEPDGKLREVYTNMKKEGLTWRIRLPLADKPDGPAIPAAAPNVIREEVEKNIVGIKKVMLEFATRLEAGDMIEEGFIRQVLDEAGRPLAATLQKMIYGQSAI